MKIEIDEVQFNPGRTGYVLKLAFTEGARKFLFVRDVDSGKILTDAKELPPALLALCRAEIREHVASVFRD